ncbi:hypothetical protein AC579_2197 [Pseudocercospora musae]|uniref:Uncharacterized protein n=1 Tax=Pseudocercospora musae TaxID=113226 RepID=A0A139IL84_9PEZI|nr:hypothetical protein AC579_2197 [Pseudocercospora musae]KXT15384.1 hypothetical protein AC579_2197 [Pseudocercospora musae]KXT15385.1 hypothetical protein AC579_2197 [Pseudocercospora musae]
MEPLNSNLQSSDSDAQMGQLNPIMSAQDNTGHNLSASEAAQTTVGGDNVTTFESLPAELRNRIYHLSGCLQFYEEPDRKAMKGGTIENLHKSWTFSTSLKEALFAGKGFNVIALAALTAKSALIDGYLMQSALSTYIAPNTAITTTDPFAIDTAAVLIPSH